MMEEPSKFNENQLSLILSELIPHLHISSLLAVRLASKEWNIAILRELKTRHLPVVLNPGNIDNFIRTFPTTCPCPFKKFHLRNITFKESQPIQCLFTNFASCVHALRLSITTPSISFNSQHFKSLMMSLPNLTKLKIDDSRFGQRIFWFGFNPTVDGLQVSSCPKLKALDLSCWCFTGRIPTAFLTNLFAATNNLASLGLRVFDPIPNDNWATFIALRDSGLNVQKLKCIKLSHINSQDLTILLELKALALEKFKVNSLYGETFLDRHVVQQMESFLAVQSASLLSLILGVNVEFKNIHDDEAPSQDHIVIKLPVLAQLRKLHLNTILYGINLQFTSFASNFPALAECIIFNRKSKFEPLEWSRVDELLEFNNWEHYFNNHHRHFSPPPEPYNLVPSPFVHQGLTRLSLTYGLHKPEQIQVLSALFPNLTTLHIVIESISLLREIWSGWPQIRHLCISISRREKAYYYSPQWNYLLENEGEQRVKKYVLCLDELITGIPTYLHNILKLIIGSSTPLLPVLNKIKRAPGLSDLKDLRILDLDIKSWGHDLTDLSVYFGFAIQGSKLKHFQVARATNISREAVADMKKILGPNVNIKFTETFF